MSYSKTYRGEVFYSGRVSYPASEHGGEIEYSGSEPVFINIDVDTYPFDTSVNDCNNAIIGLTTAVVATESAQVEAKRRTSMQMASTIVRGFFEYVRADLSQKMKELVSKCESLLVELFGHRDSCLAKRDQMQDDYSRISKRYLKIFEDLDRETVTRIEALDKPTFLFLENANQVIDRRSGSDLLGTSTVSAIENARIETILACSHVKKRAATLIEKANGYIRGVSRLSGTMKGMLYNDSSSDCIYLPVVFVENTIPGRKVSSVYGLDRINQVTGLDAYVLSNFISKEREWEENYIDNITGVFAHLDDYIKSSDMDDRVEQMMRTLMKHNSILTIKS